VSDPTGAFESWLLHRVEQAVEAREVSADLLTDLQAKMEAARDLPQEEGHALAVQGLAERLGLPVNQAETMLAALKAQPTVIRESVLRRIVEARLAGQRKAHGTHRTARESDGDQ